MAGESASDAARRMREKSERLARSADLWEQGAAGERATAGVLSGLPSTEWTVFHDLRWPGRRYANVDHVVVGPPGVFVIDSKNWSGVVAVKDQMLRQNGRSREKAVVGAAEAASAMSAMVQVVGPDHVYPVICIVGERAVTGRARDVLICSTANVLDLLLSRPRQLDAATVRQVCLELDRASRDARDRGMAPRRSKSSGVSSPVRGRPAASPAGPRRRQRSGAGARLLVGIVVAIATVGVAVSPLPRLVADWYLEVLTSDRADPAPDVADGGAEAVAPLPRLRPMLGTWTGQYRCSGRTMAATMSVNSGTSAEEVHAVLSFRPAKPRPGESSGSFRMVGAADAGSIIFRPTTWIDRPQGYQFVGLEAALPKRNDKSLSGSLTGAAACTTFAFERTP